MKKIISFVFLCFCFSAAFATLPTPPYDVLSGKAEEVKISEKNRVFVFSPLAGASIKFTADEDINTSTFSCKTYTNNPSAADNFANYSINDKEVTLSFLENGHGYILEINGETYYIYVFDYQTELFSLEEKYTECDVTAITATFNIPPMTYYIPTRGTLERIFTLKYKTLRWNENAEDFDTVDVSESLSLSGSSYTWNLDSIFINTKFTLTNENDPYKVFGNLEIESPETIAQKPIVRAVGELTLRDAKNELIDKNDPKKGSSLAGSAPMKVSLRAYKNPLARDFTWYIYEEQHPETPFSYSREQNFNLEFTTFGKYVACVTTTTEDDCVASDTISIVVSDSEMDIPNVFTPNGDGKNDKFCIAYKSIIKYNIWIYNRWGRLVFSSNSPENCWDGYIGNQKAATGAYFYKIEATGADGKKYKRAGDINLLR